MNDIKNILKKIMTNTSYYSEDVLIRNSDINYWEKRTKNIKDIHENQYLGICSILLRNLHENYLSQNLKDKNVFEIACGNGYWIKKFYDITKSYEGLEPTKNLHSIIPIKYKNFIKNKTIQEYDETNKYDIIFETISISSFYYFLTDSLLKKLINSLNDDGKLVFLETDHILEINKNLESKLYDISY